MSTLINIYYTNDYYSPTIHVKTMKYHVFKANSHLNIDYLLFSTSLKDYFLIIKFTLVHVKTKQ